MTNLHDDIKQEIINGNLDDIFTIAEVTNIKKSHDICFINGNEFPLSSVRERLANHSIGPGNRLGESIKRGQKCLYNKHEGRGRYSLYGEDNLVLEGTSPEIKSEIKVVKIDCGKNKYLNTSNGTFEKVHLDALKETIPTHMLGSWAGRNIRDYGKYLKTEGVNFDVDGLPNKAMSRGDVFEYIANKTNTTFNCCVVIFAWGEMNLRFAVMAMGTWGYWGEVAEKIRFSNVSRNKSYQLFDDLRSKKKLKGMGPAYFTKLIFFLSKKGELDIDTGTKCRGYIMDQWTARSINLLLGTHSIKLKSELKKNGKYQRLVKDINNASIYDFFCSKIEELADIIGYGEFPEIAEEFLFSIGRGKGEWRNYVVYNDKYNYS